MPVVTHSFPITITAGLRASLILSFSILFYPVTSSAQEIVRKTHVIRGAEFTQSILYQDGREVARFKFSPARGVYDIKGEMPDGAVTFEDSFRGTTGEEHYKNGRRDGPYKEYFEDGRLRMEAFYDKGEMLWQKEYYPDGQLYFVILYEDARTVKGLKERGVGKFYYADGRLKYEYNFTNRQSEGFQKAYTHSGEIRFEAYYDEFGNKIR